MLSSFLSAPAIALSEVEHEVSMKLVNCTHTARILERCSHAAHKYLYLTCGRLLSYLCDERRVKVVELLLYPFTQHHADAQPHLGGVLW